MNENRQAAPLQVEQLRHDFADLSVLEPLDLSLAAGEVLAILAPSGAGKSTLLRLLAGLLAPTSGAIRLHGQSPQQARQAKQIGFAFQEPTLLPWKTVWENIQLPHFIGKPTLDAAALEERTERLLQLVGLSDYRHFRPAQLSGGMKQRVALARLLLLPPRLLLLDEPFAALDWQTRSQLLVEFAAIIEQERIPTIFVSHQIEEAIFLADRLCVFSARPARLLREVAVDMPRPRRAALLQEHDFWKRVADCRLLLQNEWTL